MLTGIVATIFTLYSRLRKFIIYILAQYSRGKAFVDGYIKQKAQEYDKIIPVQVPVNITVVVGGNELRDAQAFETHYAGIKINEGEYNDRPSEQWTDWAQPGELTDNESVTTNIDDSSSQLRISRSSHLYSFDINVEENEALDLFVRDDLQLGDVIGLIRQNKKEHLVESFSPSSQVQISASVSGIYNDPLFD